MCGIVGYVGPSEAVEFLLPGLRRLEYRGYDSAGIVTVDPRGQFALTKTAGRIDQLAEKLAGHPTPGRIGVGHTRWATHGPPNDTNAHPHVGGNDVVALVHNGVIDNYRSLKQQLECDGYVFRTQTDSEVIAHLVASCLKKRSEAGAPVNGGHLSGVSERHALLLAAVEEAVSRLQGTYGLALLFREHPDALVAARMGSPLVVGVGHGQHYIASDSQPLVGHTDKIVYLADGEVALLTAESLKVMHRDQGPVKPNVRRLDFEAKDVELGSFPHYMLKEIFEQPESLENAMRGRLSTDEATAKFGGLNLSTRQLRSVERIVMTACGTSWHAGLVGEYLIEELAGIPVEVEYASELRYRNAPMERHTLLFAITQSGETADTLGALREVKRKGHPTLAICNVVGSTIAHEADGGVYLHAGPEIGVASTKAFTSQVAVLVMLALYFGRLRHLSFPRGLEIIEQLQALPDVVRQALQCDAAVREIAAKYAHANNFLYLGRHYNFPAALEGALKLKEISYIHAEGYPAAEMKHGPIALVDEHTPSVFVAPPGLVYDKVMANVEEIKARGGPVIAITCPGDDRLRGLADEIIEVPPVADYLQPLVTIVPLQLLAYHIAVLRGCDVDKPRNLAKSVTVE